MNGDVVYNQNRIKEIVTSFFRGLLNGHHNTKLDNTVVPFKPDYINLKKCLAGLGSLSGQESQSIHRYIELEALDIELKSCKNNKSPGLDSIAYPTNFTRLLGL